MVSCLITVTHPSPWICDRWNTYPGKIVRAECLRYCCVTPDSQIEGCALFCLKMIVVEFSHSLRNRNASFPLLTWFFFLSLKSYQVEHLLKKFPLLSSLWPCFMSDVRPDLPCYPSEWYWLISMLTSTGMPVSKTGGCCQKWVMLSS